MGAMQTQNRFLDDLARLAAGAVGGIAGIRQEVEARLREQVERLLRGMDLVNREEFEVVRAMAARARSEQEALAARVAALEAAPATGAMAGPPEAAGTSGAEQP